MKSIFLTLFTLSYLISSQTEDLDILIKLETGEIRLNDLNQNKVDDKIEKVITKKFPDKLDQKLLIDVASLIEEFINTPQNEIGRLLEIDRKLSSLYVCRDYISKKRNTRKDFNWLIRFQAINLRSIDRFANYFSKKKIIRNKKDRNRCFQRKREM